MPETPTRSTVGFYGKLPSHGDFLRRRVSEGFIRAWDPWIQACLAHSREALGDRWLDIYLTSPTWRFAAAAGACGPEPLIGIVAPSVDRVGRYFPLVVVAGMPRGHTPLAAAVAAAPFYEAAEHLVVETLAATVVDVERFDEAVFALGARLPAELEGQADDAGTDVLGDGERGSWRLGIASSRSMGAAFDALLGRHLAGRYAPLVIWCTDGSALVAPSSLVTSGLPAPEQFAGLLDGAWEGHRWRCVRGIAPAPAVDAPAAAAWAVTSAAGTHAGCVRSVNQDACLTRPEVGLWVVADGLGGLRDGEVASRMTCDALADVVVDAGFDDVLEHVQARLRQVNDYLVHAATRPVQPVRSGSTVVVLIVRGARLAVVWAGDSRAYRWREGHLEALTTDHALDETEQLAGGSPYAVTRAIGGEPSLVLDIRRDEVRPGDRYLLCSDGLTRTVSDRAIAHSLQVGAPQAIVHQLIGQALDAGAPDNVTALVVTVGEAPPAS